MGFHSRFSADGVFSVVGNIYGDVCVYYCLVHVSVCEGGGKGGGRGDNVPGDGSW